MPSEQSQPPEVEGKPFSINIQKFNAEGVKYEDTTTAGIVTEPPADGN